MTGFDYVAPPSLQDCLRIMAENSGAHVFAGGTDLLVKIRNKVLEPSMLVDIKNLEDLKKINKEEDNTLRIGSLVTHDEIIRSPMVQERFPFLADACRCVGSQQIRNRGTIGGNICNGSPSADSLPPLYVLEAKAVLTGNDGTRKIPLHELYCGPQKTCIKHSEILTSIEIPPMNGEYDGVYLRSARREAVDIAGITCAVLWMKDENQPHGKRFKIALGAVAPTVVRARTAELIVNSQPECTEDVIENTARQAMKDVSPIDDIRTTCDYRKELVYVLVKRGITTLLCRKKGL